MKRTLVGLGILAVIVGAVAGCGQDRTMVKSAKADDSRLQTLVVPIDTNVIATLDRRLTTETNRSGDSFGLTTIEPIVVDGRTVIPAGAAINGALTDVQASGRTSGRAQMTLSYRNITDAGGNEYPLTATSLSLRAESGTGTDVERMAAGGILGALVGGIAGGGKGAAIGAGAGVGAGAIVMLATQGDEVVLEAGQKVSVRLTSPVSVQVPRY